jgi:hypothetical protein
LKVQIERFALGGAAQIEFQRSARLGAGFHLGLEPAPGATAVGLRLIKRNIGVAQKLFGINPAFGQGDADAGGDDNLVPVEIVCAAERVEHAGRQRLALLDRPDGRL